MCYVELSGFQILADTVIIPQIESVLANEEIKSDCVSSYSISIYSKRKLIIYIYLKLIKQNPDQNTADRARGIIYKKALNFKIKIIIQYK